MRWVLLVEDDHLVGQALTRAIERGTGHRVRCARTPSMLWEALREEPRLPLAVVLDHDLGCCPVTGVQLLSVLRRRLPALPCALHSGCSPEALAEAFRAQGEGLGRVPCFCKPDGAAALVAWLRGLGRGDARDPPLTAPVEPRRAFEPFGGQTARSARGTWRP